MTTYLAIGRIQTSEEKKLRRLKGIFCYLKRPAKKCRNAFFSFPLYNNCVYTRQKSFACMMYDPILRNAHIYSLFILSLFNSEKQYPSYVYFVSLIQCPNY
jgi:hypothetical protein